MKKLVGLLLMAICCTAFSSEYVDGVTQTNEVLKTGMAGGQTIYGGTAAGEPLNFYSTSNAGKGKISMGSLFTINEGNGGIGINNIAPTGNLFSINRNTSFLLGIRGTETTAGRLTLRGNTVDLTTGGVTVQDTTASTTSTTGALIVSGGVGVAGDVVIATGKVLKNGTVQVVGARQTGFSAMTGTATKSVIATDTASLQDVARRLKAIDDALRAHGLID